MDVARDASDGARGKLSDVFAKISIFQTLSKYPADGRTIVFNKVISL